MELMIEEEGWVVEACRWGRAELSRSPGALKKKDLRALTRTRRASHERDPRTTPLSLFPPPPSSSSSTSSPLQKNFPHLFCTTSSAARRGPRQPELSAWLREKTKLSRTWEFGGRKESNKFLGVALFLGLVVSRRTLLDY